MRQCHLIFKLSLFAFQCTLFSCVSSYQPSQDILQGTITYPFTGSKKIGFDAPTKSFIIRSIVGNTEYIVEIPDAGEGYNIEVPLADVKSAQKNSSPTQKAKNLGLPHSTDRELVNRFPKITDKHKEQVNVLDRSFGVATSAGPKQAPSYTLGLAKVNNHYKEKAYHYALIEINNLLAHYPNSPKLHKMKGTVLIKLGNYVLAHRAWQKALDLDPYAQTLKKSLAQLERSIHLQNKQQPPLQNTQQLPLENSPGTPEILP